MRDRGVKVDTLALNILLATSVATNHIGESEQLLAEVDMPESRVADVVSYNTLIKGHAQNNDFGGAAGVLKKMRENGVQPNSITFNSAMDAAVRGQEGAAAWHLLESMRRAGIRPDKCTATILVKDLSRDQTPTKLREALRLMQEVSAQCDKSLKTTPPQSCG